MLLIWLLKGPVKLLSPFKMDAVFTILVGVKHVIFHLMMSILVGFMPEYLSYIISLLSKICIQLMELGFDWVIRISLQLVIHWKKEVSSKWEQQLPINVKKRSQTYKKWKYSMTIPVFPACNKRKIFYFCLAATILSAVIAQHLYSIVQLAAHRSSRRSKSTSDILILDC